MPTSVVPPSPAKRNRSSMSTQANLPSKSPSRNTIPDVVPTGSKKKRMVRFNLKSQPKMTAGNKEVATTAKKASAKKSSARAPKKIVRRVATPATKKTLTKQMKVASKNSPPKTKSISSIAPGNKSKSKKKISRRKVKLTISPMKIVISPPKISPSKKSEKEDDSVKPPSDNEYTDDEEDDQGTANLNTQPTESHNTTSKTFLSYFNQKPDNKYATKIQTIAGVRNHKDMKMLKRQMKGEDLVHFAFLVRYNNETLQYLDKLQQDIEAGNPEHPDFSTFPSPMAKHVENFYKCVTNMETPDAKDMFLSLNKLISIISNTQKVLDLCMDEYSEDIPSVSESRVILADVPKQMREKTETSKKSVTGPRKQLSFHEGASKSPNSETGDVEVEVDVAIDVQPLENEEEMQTDGYEKIDVSIYNSIFDKCKTDANHDAFVKLDKFCDELKIHFGKVCEQFKRASDEDVGTVALHLSEMDSFANANQLPDLFYKLSKELNIIRNHPDKETRTEILKLLVDQRNKVRYVQQNGQKYLNTLILASKVQIMLDQMCPSDCTPFIHDEASEFHLLTCEELKFKYDGLWILKKATGNCNLLGTVSEMSRAEIHLLSEGFNDLLARKGGKPVKTFPSNYLPHSAFDVLAKEEVFALYKYLKKIKTDFGREEAFSDCEAVMNAFCFHRTVLDSYSIHDNTITLSKKIGHEKNTGVFDDKEDEEELQETDQPALTIEELYRRQEEEEEAQQTVDMWSKFRGSYEDIGLTKPVKLGEGVSPDVTDDEDGTGGQQLSPSASIAENEPVVEEMQVDEPEGTNIRDVAEVAGGQPHSPSASIAESEPVVEEMQVVEPEGTNVRDVAEVAGGQPHSPSALIAGEAQGSNVLQVGTGVTVVSDASLAPQLSPDASIQDPKQLHSTPLEKDAISRRNQQICDAGNLTPIPAPQPTGEERQDDLNDGHCSTFEESYVNFLRKNYDPQNSQQSNNEEASSERPGTVIFLL